MCTTGMLYLNYYFKKIEVDILMQKKYMQKMSLFWLTF